ncbi:uncharacterized protein Dana_GF27130 [Drosophila ananassae]|uniref:Uncharacterized protein n=1 Tax=Drosophila ananassae TaxID=7217 RepID=A0A0P8XDX0_DROAN|nr:uncharacterized protein LOC26514539 [Drosophila ananassae]KPU73000.1 uncharacterized protein Dana_GF27130 [Drosophila ananassae]
MSENQKDKSRKSADAKNGKEQIPDDNKSSDSRAVVFVGNDDSDSKPRTSPTPKKEMQKIPKENPGESKSGRQSRVSPKTIKIAPDPNRRSTTHTSRKAISPFVVAKKPLPPRVSEELLEGPRVSDRKSERMSDKKSMFGSQSIFLRKKSLDDRIEQQEDKKKQSSRSSSISKERKSTKPSSDDEKPSTSTKTADAIALESLETEEGEEARERGVTISEWVSKKTINSQESFDVGDKGVPVDAFGSDDDYDVEDSEDTEYLEKMLRYENRHTRDGIEYRSMGTQSDLVNQRKPPTSGLDWSLSTDATGSDESTWEEGMLEDDGLYGSSTINSTQSVDDRSVILAEIIDIGKLKELKQDDDSAHDFRGSRRMDKTIDEIRCPKVTGTAKNHIEEVGYPSSTDEDEDNYAEKNKKRKRYSLLCKTKSETEISDVNQRSRMNYMQAKKDSRPTGLNKWRFLIEENVYEISGQPQQLRQKDKLCIGKQTKSHRSIGVNTDISRKPGSKDEGSAKVAEPVAITVQPTTSHGRSREVGVNTTIPVPLLQPYTSLIRHHNHGRLRDIGTNTPKYYEAFNDGKCVKFSDPIHSDVGYINKLIVKIPKSTEDVDLKSRSRLYYEDCEHHFPKRNWRRYYYKKDEQGRHVFRRPSRWLYTILFTIGYLLFVLLFAMAWFDHVTSNTSVMQPMIRMAQPSLSFAPSGSRSSPNSIEFDPRNASEVMEKYTKVLTLMEKYGNNGQNPRFGPCVASEKFGYEIGEPCVFVKINRIIGFKTDPFTDARNVVRGNMEMVDFMAVRSLLNSIPSDADREGRTWLLCSTGSKKSVQIEFYPEPAFRTQYTDIESKIEYISENRTSFFSPKDLNRIVALKIKNLQPNERVHVKCQIFARNINHDGQGLGHVSFYVILANKKNREKMHKVLRHDSL